MRYICSKCEQILDEEEAIIFMSIKSRLITDVYCSSCYRTLKNEDIKNSNYI